MHVRPSANIMIPSFDQNGLLPVGEYECSLAEIQQQLCWNEHRLSLHTKFCEFLNKEWDPIGSNGLVFVDGSFVRNKDFPADIDVVADITSELDTSKIGSVIMLWIVHQRRLKDEYNVDFWVKHPSLPNDLVEFFQYAGTKACAELSLGVGHKKGILRIAL